jgi:hypothetical protein
MREERMHARTGFSVAEFVVDASIFLLDGPHDLYLDAAQAGVTVEARQ